MAGVVRSEDVNDVLALIRKKSGAADVQLATAAWVFITICKSWGVQRDTALSKLSGQFDKFSDMPTMTGVNLTIPPGYKAN